MNSRERVINILSHKEPDKVAKYEWYWHPTLERWKNEGLGDRSPNDEFDLDIAQINIDNSFLIEKEVIEETDEYIIHRDEWGCVMKDHKDLSTTPMYLEFPVKNRDMWEKEYKPLLKMSPRRINAEQHGKIIQAQREKGKFIVVGGLLNFEATWRKVGIDTLLMIMATDPEFAMDMFRADTEIILETLQGFVDCGLEVDGTFFAEDMAYKGRTLFSQDFYCRFLKPLHKEFFDFCHKQGWKNIMHSCGCVESFIPDLIDAGLDCLQSLEVKSGMDLVELNKVYGKSLSFMGGIDARKFVDGDLVEFERYISEILEQVKPGGGYIFMSDHSIPSMPLDVYRKEMAIVEKYLSY